MQGTPAILREITSFGGRLNEKGPPTFSVLHMDGGHFVPEGVLPGQNKVFWPK